MGGTSRGGRRSAAGAFPARGSRESGRAQTAPGSRLESQGGNQGTVAPRALHPPRPAEGQRPGPAPVPAGTRSPRGGGGASLPSVPQPRMRLGACVRRWPRLLGALFRSPPARAPLAPRPPVRPRGGYEALEPPPPFPGP